MTRPAVVCLTPVLNEAWMLERFLKCASLWADHIIIADQGSTDGSRDIARRFPKVTLVDNASATFNEPERQALLLAKAREISGPKVLIALDADEILTANVLTDPEWQTIVGAPPGTSLRFQWTELGTDFQGLNHFLYPAKLPFGFVDDGSEHQGKRIHSRRVPVPVGAKTLLATRIKVMHYCQVDRDRFESRIRWYECWEHLQAHRRPIEIYRFYQRELHVPSSVIKPVPPDWLQGYVDRGIDMTSVLMDGIYRWDREVLRLFEEHGTARFRRLPVWDFDWDKAYALLYPESPPKHFADPRSRFDRLVHWWLRRTQSDLTYHASIRYRKHLYYQLVQRLISVFGW
jgi:glycosyltransferase involved in cell wall biosynthesis